MTVGESFSYGILCHTDLFSYLFFYYGIASSYYIQIIYQMTTHQRQIVYQANENVGP